MASAATINRYLSHITAPARASRPKLQALRRVLSQAIDLRTVYAETLARSVGQDEHAIVGFLAECRMTGSRDCPFDIVSDPALHQRPTTIYLSLAMYARITRSGGATRTKKASGRKKRGSHGTR